MLYIRVIGPPGDITLGAFSRAHTVIAALVAAVACLCTLAASASAVIVQLPDGRAVSYRPLGSAAHRATQPRPFDQFFSNLDYNGGPVMPSNTNFTVYWRPKTATPYPLGYTTGLNTYFEDLAHDSGEATNVDSVSAQYNDSAGQFASYQSTFGGELVDEDPYPPNGCTAAAVCLTDAQIQEELEKFIVKEKKPIDLEHEYFLLTPPGVESCFEEASNVCSAGSSAPFFCAYHGNIPMEGGAKQLIYANDPFVTGILGCDDPANHPNESPSDGALFGGLSHEHNESLTDPEPNNAWTDFGGSGGEVGDKCGGEFLQTGEPLGEASDGSSYNQVINGHFYWYQEEWSNQGHNCLQRLSFKGEEPTATFTTTPGAGTEVQFDASGSTAPGGVSKYNWQFNDGPETISEPAESSSPTISHTFPAPGTYTVALTVFAADGTSIGTAKTMVVSTGPPTAAFSTSGTSVAGQQIFFDGTASSDPGGFITQYTWSFGDGSPQQTGATPTAGHVYAVPGSYEVTLTVKASSGLTASVTHTLAIAASSGGSEGPTSGGPPAASGPIPLAQIALTGRVTLPATSVQVGPAGKGGVSLSCAGTVSRCSGNLTLTATVTVHRNGRRHRRTVTIGSTSFSIVTGGSARVTITLNSLGRRLLRRARGHLHASLLIRATAPVTTAAAGHAVQLAARPH